jgi:hypothetical protein
MTRRYPARCQPFNHPPSSTASQHLMVRPQRNELHAKGHLTELKYPRTRSTDDMQPPHAHAQIEGALIGMCGRFVPAH